MPFNLIRPQQFTTVLSALTDPSTVYIVPSFQRPYAWETEQIYDLLRDMEKATAVAGSHYLSALHLIGLDLGKDPTLVEFLDDADNNDLGTLRRLAKADELRTTADAPIHAYAVVDGQQRLTTLLLLTHIYYHHEAVSSKYLDLDLRSDTSIPRLIQNPASDHQFMKEVIDWIKEPNRHLPVPRRESQRRLLSNTQAMRTWAEQHRNPLRFLRSEKFKTSAIELEADYGLTSFLTLNDRGRPLTVLEKLKSLLLQFASDARALASDQAATLIHRLHIVFGKLYQVLDDCQHVGLMPKKNGDDEMVRLLSCYLHLANDSSAIYKGADAAYQEFFRDYLMKRPSEVLSVVNNWCAAIDEMSGQISQLNRYLGGNLGGHESSLHFGNRASLSDDYRVTVLSLKPQPHLLALLLKFRATFKIEWHERFAVTTPALDLGPIDTLLRNVRARAQAESGPSALEDYIDGLSHMRPDRRRQLSALEVVEQLQLLDWNLGSRKIAGFAFRWTESLGQKFPAEFVNSWAAWRTSDDFIRDILYRGNETNIRYVLKEFEREYGQNLHFVDQENVAIGPVELEHIFPQNIESTPSFDQIGRFSGIGIADRSEYDTNVLWRSGNFTWLSKSANAALGNQLPNVKAAHFHQCPGHLPDPDRNRCSRITITRKVGEELGGLGVEYKSFRLYIEARCAELALFMVRRFC